MPTRLPENWHIPANRGSPAMVGTSAGITNRHVIPNDDADMESVGEPDNGRTAESSSTLMGARGTSGSKGGVVETPVIRQTPHYGLPDRVTVVLPSTIYFAAITPTSFNSMTRVQVRLTSMFDKLITTRTTPVGSAAYAAGIYDRMMAPASTATWLATPPQFPNSVTDNMQWRTYYTAMYQYYHCMGVEWELTMMNPQTNDACDIAVATYIDTFSSNNAGNIHPTTYSMQEIEQWPDVRWTLVNASNENARENYKTIKGYYRPGMVKQNVENDEDVKTWTGIASVPALQENLTIAFGKAAFNSITAATGVNCRLKMRFIMQFKDINVQYKWPASGQSVITVAAPTDILV